MSEFKLQYKPFGERSILIEWPQVISENVLESLLSYKHKLENHYFKQKVYIKHAYNSILITYSISIDNFYDKILALESVFNSEFKDIKTEPRLWNIPVCYNQEFGVDLEDVSNKSNLTISDIIQLHTGTKYTVYFLGFLPGFLYLGGLNKKLHFPRKKSPRLIVEKGSVAIGGSQTGIYPTQSPGGWQIIGKTPIDFFDFNAEKPCFAKAGDKIQFVSVSRSDYDSIHTKVVRQDYIIESEVIDD